MNAAETMRRAAAVMRERAEKTADLWRGNEQGISVPVAPDAAPMLEHYFSWTPDVALTVADLLDDYAAFLTRERLRLVDKFGEDVADDFLPDNPKTLAVARAYLGESA